MIKRRVPLAFYILKGYVYYSTEKGGLDHDKLWKLIVTHTFPHLDSQNKADLLNAPYAADRGRLVWSGTEDLHGYPDENKKGKYTLYGTPDCKPYEDKLLKLFKLSDLKGTDKLDIDWKTDSHYKTLPYDMDILDFLIKITKDKTIYQDTHIAKLKVLAKEALRKTQKAKHGKNVV